MLNSIQITRFPNGVNNQALDTIFSSLPFSPPVDFYQYLEDFMTYAAAEWTVTETQAGATQALTDGAGGQLLITNSAADDDAVTMQKVGEAFLPVVGKLFAARLRFKVSDATQSDLLVGLAITDTTPLDATDGIYVTKADGSTALNLIVRKDATTGSESLALGNMANDTFIIVDLFYDGGDRLYAAVNGSVVGYLPYTTAYIPDTEITPTIALVNGEAAAKTLTVDLLWFAQQR